MLRPSRPVRTVDLDAAAERHPGGLWIFGYGSLMWRPGFRYARAAQARLTGYHRCFCIYSMHHRGTEQRPGLVLGLDRAGVCEGIAFHVRQEDMAATLDYLTVREQVSGVYRETQIPVTLLDGSHREVLAIAYVVERAHPSYAGDLPLRRQACLIRGAEGISGANLDYLLNTLAHLRELRIRDRALERLATLIGPHFARDPKPGPVSPRVAALRSVCCRLPVPHPRLRTFERTRFVHRKHVTGRVV